jgi:uncharacterized protein (TIGR03435 family)
MKKRRQEVRKLNGGSKLLLCSLFALLLAVAAYAQAPVVNAAPGFEVATIKPSSPEERGRSIGWEGRRFTAKYTTMSQMAQFAFSLQGKQIVGAPAWFDAETFDIEIVSEKGEPTVQEWRAILQRLLAERFGLKYHREQKVMPAYILSVAKTGPKLDGEKADSGTLPMVRIQRGPHQFMKVMGVNGSMADLAAELQRVETDRPVVDGTGLHGRYNFTLTATSTKQFFAGETPDTRDDAPPELFTAIREQLGLKLEPAKAPVDCLVIDHVERASAN